MLFLFVFRKKITGTTESTQSPEQNSEVKYELLSILSFFQAQSPVTNLKYFLKPVIKRSSENMRKKDWKKSG